MLVQPVADKIAAHLEATSASQSAEMLDDVLSAAGKLWKPTGYDDEMNRRRAHYEGRGNSSVMQALRRRYPRTGPEMSVTALNLVRTIAEIDASVYDYAPERYLVGADGRRLDSADDDARAFADALQASQIDSVMIEAERRLMVCETLPLRVGWDRIRGGPTITPYWPADVFVLPDPMSPTDPRRFLALAARISGPSGLDAGRPGAALWYELWWRASLGDDAYGPWHMAHVSSAGDSYSPFGEDAKTAWPVPDVLPWVWMRQGDADGTPWVWRSLDLIPNVESVQVTWCNIFFTLDMQAHDELVLTSNGTKKEDITGGPNRVHQLRVGESLSSVTKNPKIRELVDTVKDYMRALAVTRRQSEDAYSWERGAPLTGVSRRIKNEPQEKARREQAIQRRREEEERPTGLLWQIVKLHDAHAGTSWEAGGYAPRMVPREPPDYEEPVQRQQRASDAAARGYISHARAAVESGWYPDIESAVTAGLSDAIAPSATLQT